MKVENEEIDNIKISDKDKKSTSDYGTRLVGQNIRKIADSGTVQRLNGEVVNINVNSKNQLKLAVELQIIGPYTSSSKRKYSLEMKEEIKDLIRRYDEIFEEEYAKYLENRDYAKDLNASKDDKDTNISRNNGEENTTKLSGVDPAILESSQKLNKLIKRTIKPVERTYVDKIDVKSIKPFTVIDGEKKSSSGKIGKLKDRYNNVVESKKKQKTIDLDMNFNVENEEKEDLAK